MITALWIYGVIGLVVFFVVLGWLVAIAKSARDLTTALPSALMCGLLWPAVCVTLVVGWFAHADD